MNISVQNKLTVRRWTIATFLGWLGGVILIILFSAGVESFGVDGLQFHIGTAMGLSVGFFQWRILKKDGNVSTKWIWFTAAGLSIPFILVEGFLFNLSDLKLPVCVFLGSILVGILQSLVLKGRVSNPRAWIVSSMAGWTLSVMTVFAMNYTMQLRGQYSGIVLASANLILILSGGIVLGLVTGISLKRSMG